MKATSSPELISWFNFLGSIALQSPSVLTWMPVPEATMLAVQNFTFSRAGPDWGDSKTEAGKGKGILHLPHQLNIEMYSRPARKSPGCLRGFLHTGHLVLRDGVLLKPALPA